MLQQAMTVDKWYPTCGLGPPKGHKTTLGRTVCYVYNVISKNISN